jgi:hypothetical protein
VVEEECGELESVIPQNSCHMFIIL